MTSGGAAEAIVLAAERLIAERGNEVALRDIAAAAGQRNNSAVHYHFGSRDGLITAIIERRQAPMELRRMQLLAQHEIDGGSDELHVLVDILLRPMVEVPYADGSTHYARFLERVRNHPAVLATGLSPEHGAAVQIVAARLDRALAEIAPRVRRRRLTAMATVLFGLLADHERASAAAGRRPGDDGATIDDMVAMIVGLLTAPVPG